MLKCMLLAFMIRDKNVGGVCNKNKGNKNLVKSEHASNIFKSFDNILNVAYGIWLWNSYL